MGYMGKTGVHHPETTSFNPNPRKKCLKDNKQYLGNDIVVLATTYAFESDMKEKTKPALLAHILMFFVAFFSEWLASYNDSVGRCLLYHYSLFFLFFFLF